MWGWEGCVVMWVMEVLRWVVMEGEECSMWEKICQLPPAMDMACRIERLVLVTCECDGMVQGWLTPLVARQTMASTPWMVPRLEA